jgi:hypothetical protein
LAAAKAVPNGPELYAIAPMRPGELLADEPAALLQSANTLFRQEGSSTSPLPSDENPSKALLYRIPTNLSVNEPSALRYVHLVLIATTEPRRRPILAPCAAKTIHDQLNSVKQPVPHGRILPDPIV